MAKPNVIELGLGKHAVSIPILHEDRAVLAIDKPVGWMPRRPHLIHRRRRFLGALPQSQIPPPRPPA
jgi:23S rRNA-/tRNA-specific pseudouridylate synthase